jgi:UDP:flavonoid glycosyltransferase YjiC (YdhE family)
MFNSNDLGPVSRLLPIAQELFQRGHEVAFSNREEVPSLLIRQAGFKNLPVIPSQWATVQPSKKFTEVWNANQFASGSGFLDVDFVRAITLDYIKVLTEYNPDIVVDTWGFPACLAAKILRIPLVTITQADLHPDGKGFVWWRQPPPDLPNPVPVVNEVLKEYQLPPLEEKMEELLMGDQVLIVGTPDTDPLPESSSVTYIGPLQGDTRAASLPDWIQELPTNQPLVWVYSGNPRYKDRPSKIDSIIVIRAGVAALGNEEVQLVLSTGYQPLPEEFKPLPPNIHYTAYVPGFAMAQKSDLVVHHGGHGSTLTGLSAGTPAVIIPTYSERESNARRLASLGAGEFVLPQTDERGEKFIELDEFRGKVWRVLGDPRYKHNAQRAAKNAQQYGGANQAADLIERFAGQL